MLTRHAGPLKARSLLARAEEVKVAYLSTYPPRECGIARAIQLSSGAMQRERPVVRRWQLRTRSRRKSTVG